MSFIAAAIVTTAAVGVYAAGEAADAQSDAAAQSAAVSSAATQSSNELTAAMYEQGREDMLPWMAAGTAALDRLEQQPDFQFNASEFEFMADPSYQFRLEEGINALDQSAASRGRILSGAQDKAVTGYAGDMASKEYQNAFNRWQSEESNRFSREQSVYNTNENADRYLAGQGQAASAGQAAAGNQMANATANTTMAGATAVGNAYTAAGNATAAGYNGMATSVNTGVENYLLM